MTKVFSPARAFGAASAMTALNVAVASGFALAGLLAPQTILPAGAAPSEASLVFALYAAARTLPLAAGVCLAIARRSTPALLILGSLAGAIQTIDAAVGLVQHDIGKTVGPLAIAALQFATLLALRRAKSAPDA
jgi:hypothetical protein